MKLPEKLAAKIKPHRGKSAEQLRQELDALCGRRAAFRREHDGAGFREDAHARVDEQAEFHRGRVERRVPRGVLPDAVMHEPAFAAQVAAHVVFCSDWYVAAAHARIDADPSYSPLPKPEYTAEMRRFDGEIDVLRVAIAAAERVEAAEQAERELVAGLAELEEAATS